MSHKTISQQSVLSIDKLISNILNYFDTVDVSEWVNGRPVLINGDVWCPMCKTWHVNNTVCQQS